MKKTTVLLAVLLLFGTFVGCAPKNPTAFSPLSHEFSPDKTEERALPDYEIAEQKSPTPELAPMEGMGNSDINICNEGYAVFSDGVLYFADRQNGGNIWRADPDGGNAQMLTEGSFKSLNVSGDRLFFSDWDGIYVMPIDGGQPKLIKECWLPLLCVADEWLYYSDDSCIYRMQADGTETKLLAKDVSGDFYTSFIIDGDWLYYLRYAQDNSCKYLWKTALDGSETAQVSDAKVSDFLIYEGYIYFLDWDKLPYGLDKMALDGTGRQEIYSRDVQLCSAADGWIYLLSKPRMDSVNGMYRLRTDGSGLENVTEGHCFDVSAAGEWLFFCNNDENFRISKMKLDGSERGFCERGPDN